MIQLSGALLLFCRSLVFAYLFDLFVVVFFGDKLSIGT